MTAPVPALVLTPLHPAAPIAGGTLEVLVRVQAPPPPAEAKATPRLPLRLAVVVDRSGSMDGAPLQEALRCAEYIAAGLQPADKLAVVVYDNNVQVLAPLAPPDKTALHTALADVQSGGSTALFDGWQAGAKCLEGAGAQSISRVILLSDGQANAGECDPAAVARHCAGAAAGGVTTTTVGLGRHFNEDLMIAMARAGRGQGYYGQTAEDLHDNFDEELSLLQSTFLRGLQVKLLPGAGVVLEVLGAIPQAGNGAWQLPDLAWGAEAWLLVRLHLAAAGADANPAQKQALLAAALSAQGEEGAAVELSAVLSLPLVPPSDLAGLPQDETVARRLQEVQFASATSQVRELMNQGDSEAAKALLARLEAQVASHPWLADKVAQMKQLALRDAAMAAKEMCYSAQRSSSRLANVAGEALYTFSETNSATLAPYLRRKSSEGQGRRR